LTQRLWMTGITILVILVGFVLRIYHLDSVALRGDEAFTASYWVNQPIGTTLAEIATIDPHPPLAYASFRAWGAFAGTSEFALRYLPTLINILGIAAVYALGKRINGYKLGLLAAFLFAVHPFLVWHSQDARNYAVWSGLSAVSFWLAARVVDRDARGWVFYVIAALLSAYIYYLELFILAALNLYVFLCWRKKTVWLIWIAMQMIIGGALSFWFLQPRLLTGSGYGGTTGQFVPSQLLDWFLPALNFGRILTDRWDIIVWLPLLLAISAGAYFLWRDKRRYAILLLCVGVLPMLLLGLVSTRLNVFTPRYVLASVPALMLLFAAFVTYPFSANIPFKQPVVRAMQVISVAGLIAWLSIAGHSLWRYYTGVPKTPDWRIITDYLREHTAENDVIIQRSVDAAFGYYYASHTDEFGLPAHPNQPAEEIHTILNQYREDYSGIWLVGKAFPDWSNFDVVDNWANDNMQLVRETIVADVPVSQHLTWQVAELNHPDEPIGQFKDTVSLISAKISNQPEPTGELFIWLYWQPQARTEQPLKVFVHLIGGMNPATDSPLWAQDDRFPQNGRIETTTWDTETIYRDVYRLSVGDVPAGDYALLVGLYNPETNERLITPTGEDHINVGQVTLE